MFIIIIHSILGNKLLNLSCTLCDCHLRLLIFLQSNFASPLNSKIPGGIDSVTIVFHSYIECLVPAFFSIHSSLTFLFFSEGVGEATVGHPIDVYWHSRVKRELDLNIDQVLYYIPPGGGSTTKALLYLRRAKRHLRA